MSTLSELQAQLEAFREAGRNLQLDPLMTQKAQTFNNLGNFLNNQSQFTLAEDSCIKSLEISQAIEDEQTTGTALNGLGNTYVLSGQYQLAIDFYQQSLETQREIGDYHGEALSYFYLGITFAHSDLKRLEAVWLLQKARTIFARLGLKNMVQQCDAAINQLNGINDRQPHCE
jgi:tetratricopeptide (TPR) repeat protein